LVIFVSVLFLTFPAPSASRQKARRESWLLLIVVSKGIVRARCRSGFFARAQACAGAPTVNFINFTSVEWRN